MAEITAASFTDLCAQGPVQEQIRTIEDRRRAALTRFWTTLLIGLAIGLVLAFVVSALGGGPFGFVAFFLVAIIAFVVAQSPLAQATTAIKHPALHALAAQGGMTYMPSGFDPPVFGEAVSPLFGNWLSSTVFTDLMYGADAEGRNFAFYEGSLTRGHGKHRQQVFSGQFYAFQRRRTQQGAIVAVPDRGIFNFFKPSGGFERVRFESDQEFERRFEVYGTHAQEALMLFANTALRHFLLYLRQNGRVFVYVGPSDVLVAVTGPNRFEPGSMFGSRPGEERVRLMFNDVCASLDILKNLKATLG